MATNYYNKAKAMADPTYNERVQSLKNAMSTQLLNLENSKGGINQNYNNQVTGANEQTALQKNNYANNSLSRGLGRSTIVTSGLAGMDDANADVLKEIAQDRTSALNQVDREKVLTQNNTLNQINAINADRAAAIQKMMDELQYRDQQLALQRQKAAATAYNKTGGMVSVANNPAVSQTRKDAVKAVQNYANDIRNESDRVAWLKTNKGNIVKSIGNDAEAQKEYQRLLYEAKARELYNKSKYDY